MKYNVDKHGYLLLIYNDSGMQIFGITKNNCWGKHDYNQHGKQIYREDSTGDVDNYEI